MLAKQPSPSGGVDWLLLKATSTSGPGRFATVTYIRRLDTVGGRAPPASRCSSGTQGRTTAAPYSATCESTITSARA